MTGICRPVSKEAVRSPSAAAHPPSPQGGGSGSIGRGLNSMSAARLPPKSATTKIRCLRASLREPAQYLSLIHISRTLSSPLAAPSAVRFPFPSENGYSRPPGRPHTRRQRALHHWLNEWEKGQLVIRSCFGRPFLPAFLPLPAYGSTERGG